MSTNSIQKRKVKDIPKALKEKKNQTLILYLVKIDFKK